MNHTALVKEFADTFGVETPSKPTMPERDICALRSSLIDEERVELLNAANQVEALDAIADLLYVVHGAALAYGFTPEQVDAAFREVHRSNMSKLWEVDDFENSMPECDIRKAGNGRYVVKRADGKILKSPSYSPARLEEIVGGVK